MRRSVTRFGVPAPYTATLAPISDPAGNPATIMITSIMTNRPAANCGVCKTNEKTNEDCRCLPGEKRVGPRAPCQLHARHQLRRAPPSHPPRTPAEARVIGNGTIEFQQQALLGGPIKGRAFLINYKATVAATGQSVDCVAALCSVIAGDMKKNAPSCLPYDSSGFARDALSCGTGGLPP